LSVFVLHAALFLKACILPILFILSKTSGTPLARMWHNFGVEQHELRSEDRKKPALKSAFFLRAIR